MSAVYVVDQLSTGKQRALKVMAPELAMDELARERFVREARVGAQIDSDHVVDVITAGVDEGPVLGQARVPVLPGDDEAALAARVLAAEHKLYPECLGQFATNLA